MQKVAFLILAAGTSSRMKDKVKQLLPWKNTTLLGQAITEAKKITKHDVFVVLGANAALIKPHIKGEKITIFEHEHWNNGLGSSIAFGVTHLSSLNFYDAVFIILADQPLIDAQYLKGMLKEYERDTAIIVATKYPNNNGVPAIFAKEYFDDLVNLTGDTGAKYLINTKNVVCIDPKEKSIDIDTWEEYERLRNNFKV
jgi:molybdenum cofactor cytidylyltransferase